MTISREQFEEGSYPDFDWTDLLLAIGELVPEYILEVHDGHWECRCGNSTNAEGFDACNEFGKLIPAELGPWDGALQVCIRCWRIIDGNTLQVLGFAETSTIAANTDLYWGI